MEEGMEGCKSDELRFKYRLWKSCVGGAQPSSSFHAVTEAVLFSVSFSTGSTSSPALWASESFTQGSRSMAEVRRARKHDTAAAAHVLHVCIYIPC